MPYKRKDSPYYWITYTDAQGRRIRESSGYTSRKDATALEAKRRLDHHKASKWGDEPPRLFDDLVTNYLDDTESKKSHWRDLYSVDALTPFFTGRYLNEITPADINEYRQSRKVKDATVAKEIRFLSAAINHARKHWGWNVQNVAAGRAPRKKRGRLRWLRHEEAERLLTACEGLRGGHLKDVVELVLNTGLRKGEVLGLEWSRVDLKNRLLYFHPDNVKSGASESVPLNAPAAAILERWQDKDDRWVFTYRGSRILDVKTGFAAACRKAKIEDFRFHDLRHTFAAWLAQAGVPIRTISELLRHADITTTMIYAHLAPDNVHDAVAILARDQIVTHLGNNVTKTANLCKP